MTPLAEPTLLDFVQVCLRLRGDNVDEYLARTFADRFDPDRVALEFASKDGPRFVYHDANGVPVCVAGLTLKSPGVMDTWFLCTDDFDRHVIAITRHIRFVFRAALDSTVHRIEHTALASRTMAHAWYAVLGLKPFGVARACGKHGQDMVLFERIRGDANGRRS